MSDEHMSDKDMDAVLREWTQDAPAGQPDRSRVVGDVVRQLGSTRRRRRRWWLQRLFSRKPDEPAAIDKAQYQPDPNPASNGHTPTVIGRTSSMLSPVKAITAGALVFALGGAFLIAQPFQQQGSVPAVQSDAASMDAAWVTGTLLHGTCTPPDRTIDGDVVHEVGHRCESQIWETDDARLSGTATSAWNADVYRLGPDVSVSTGTYDVETETGRWLCSSGPTVAQGSGLFASTNPETITCEGQDAYAGLGAVLNVDVDAGSIEGLVFAGEVPESPKPTGQ